MKYLLASMSMFLIGGMMIQLAAQCSNATTAFMDISADVMQAAADSMPSQSGPAQLIEAKEPIEAIITKAHGTKFRLSLDPGRAHIRYLNAGESVIVIGAQGYFFKARYHDDIGFIHYLALERKNDLEKLIRASIAELGARIDSLRKDYESDPAWIGVIVADARILPKASAKSVTQLRRGAKVFIRDRYHEWVHVRIPTRAVNISSWRSIDEFSNSYIDGWLPKSALSTSPVNEISDVEYRREAYLRNNSEIAPEFKNAIRSGRVLIGMTMNMVVASIGPPADVNRTTTAGVVSEQWVYPRPRKDLYVYFDNGVLTAWQD